MMRRALQKVLRVFRAPRENSIMRKHIQGRRVLILGSGPSAKELENIPDDVLIFSCNTGPQLLLEKNITNKVHVYLGNKKGFINYGEVMAGLVRKLDIELFLTRSVPYVKKHKFVYKDLVQERVTNSTYFLERLTGKETAQQITQNDSRPSAGIGLLEYALYFGAKEIYIIGIDLSTDTEGHIFDEPKERRYSPHEQADKAFVKWVSESYKNVYSASSTSPLSKVFSHRVLE